MLRRFAPGRSPAPVGPGAPGNRFRTRRTHGRLRRCSTRSPSPSQLTHDGGRDQAEVIAKDPVGRTTESPCWRTSAATVQGISGTAFAATAEATSEPRVEVQPDDVAHFLDEERIGGQLEGLRQVRLDPERSIGQFDINELEQVNGDFRHGRR